MKRLVFAGLAALALTAGVMALLLALPAPRSDVDGGVLLILDRTELYKGQRTFTYTIVNGLDERINFGEPYDIQIYRNGEWKSVEWMRDRAWILILHVLEPRSSFSRVVELPEEVELGRYRLVKEVMVERKGEEITLTAEFEVLG
uniref:Bacterial Ig-like domain-containing protein n=1 Tax=Caldiarchaeum subterraneum TaxID=311458 RepID=A0A7J3VTV0_CALS0